MTPALVWIITRRNWILLGSLALCLAGVVARRLLDWHEVRWTP